MVDKLRLATFHLSEVIFITLKFEFRLLFLIILILCYICSKVQRFSMYIPLNNLGKQNFIHVKLQGPPPLTLSIRKILRVVLHFLHVSSNFQHSIINFVRILEKQKDYIRKNAFTSFCKVIPSCSIYLFLIDLNFNFVSCILCQRLKRQHPMYAKLDTLFPNRKS